MVKQSGRQVGGRRRTSSAVKNPGLKPDKEISSAAKRALAVRRLWLCLLTAALLAVGIASVCGVRF